MHQISWKYSFEKKSKTVLDTFFRLNEITTTGRESNYLRFTNKRLSLLHNNGAQMLTRQDVNYCSEREFEATFQFYQALLLAPAPKVSCYCTIGSVACVASVSVEQRTESCHSLLPNCTERLATRAVGSVSSEFLEFSFLWLVPTFMNRSKQR